MCVSLSGAKPQRERSNVGRTSEKLGFEVVDLAAWRDLPIVEGLVSCSSNEEREFWKLTMARMHSPECNGRHLDSLLHSGPF